MKSNNKGFSLVELIIAVGMFTIVGAMIVSFVAISTRTYTNISSEIDVQQEAQLTMNQIKDLVIDTNRAVAYGLEAPDPSNMKEFTKIDETNTETSIISSWIADGVNENYIKKVLVIYSEENMTTTQADGTLVSSYTYPIIKIIYDSNKNQLFYAEQTFSDVSLIDISSFGTASTDIYLLSEYVTNFQVDLSDILNSQVDLEVDFSSSSQAGVGREYFSTPTINLRNKIIVSENLSEIYTNTEVEMNSFVLGIDILKEGTIIHGDSIQLGSSITYTAEVEAQYGASDAYTWKLTGDASGFKSTVSGAGEVTVPLDEPSSTLTLTAIAVGDTTKIASIPITISGEIRPTNISITSSETAIMGNADSIRKIYTFTAVTTYTDGSTTTGGEVNWTEPSNMPSGAYTTVNAKGQMLLYLMANGGLQDYVVSVRATELNVAGGIVSATKIVTPGDLSYVEPSIMTVNITPNGDTISRGDSRTLTASVSDFTGNEDNLNYTWEILEAESVGFSGSGINSINKVHLEDAGSTGKQKKLAIDKDLNWAESFTIKVKVTAYDNVVGEIQEDSFIAYYYVTPVTIDITRVSSKIQSWRYQMRLKYSLNHVILDNKDWDDVNRSFTFSGVGYQHWGDYHDMTFDHDDISPESQKIVNKSIAVGGVYAYANGGYITTAYFTFDMEYKDSKISSAITEIE